MDFKKMGAEFAGTAVLVVGGIGAAVFAGKQIGTLGIALAFGVTLLAVGYAIGPISGAHVNPAVTLGYLLSGRMRPGPAIQYWVAQFLGGILGAALVVVVRSRVSGINQKLFGANGYGSLSQTHASIAGAFFVEILAALIFVFVVLSVTSRVAESSFSYLTSGLMMFVAYLITIPVTNGGVNPARSLGPAIFAGGAAFTQVWVFVVAPLLGSVLAVIAHVVVSTERHSAAEPDQPAPARPARREPARAGSAKRKRA
ncbi:MAG: aquaporin [Streptosporangiales bacterium]|nr:aquaporin [Streptosporangiales bacterium]